MSVTARFHAGRSKEEKHVCLVHGAKLTNEDGLAQALWLCLRGEPAVPRSNRIDDGGAPLELYTSSLVA